MPCPLTNACPCTVILAVRQLCARLSQAAPAPSVDKSSLSKLRKETGFAFSNCRKALVLHDNDFDKVEGLGELELMLQHQFKFSNVQTKVEILII